MCSPGDYNILRVGNCGLIFFLSRINQSWQEHRLLESASWSSGVVGMPCSEHHHARDESQLTSPEDGCCYCWHQLQPCRYQATKDAPVLITPANITPWQEEPSQAASHKYPWYGSLTPGAMRHHEKKDTICIKWGCYTTCVMGSLMGSTLASGKEGATTVHSSSCTEERLTTHRTADHHLTPTPITLC